ncbi:MAG: hypothetical protein ACPLUL_13860 [Thermanaerothrix sp.]|jgi:hypothetical protein
MMRRLPVIILVGMIGTVRFEGVQPGQCLIRNGAFQVTIKVVEQPSP